MTITIKRAETADDFRAAYPLLCQLMPYLPDAPFEDNLRAARDRGYTFYLAYNDQQVVGCVGYWVYVGLGYGRILFVTHLVVDETKRGQQIGSQLLAFIDQRAREEGCHTVQLYSNFSRDRTHNFYDTNGFARYGIMFEKKLS